jgi:hypothetical protein
MCGIDCNSCQNKFFVNSPLEVKGNYENALDFAPHLFRLLVSVSLDIPFKYPCTAYDFFPGYFYKRCQGLRSILLEISSNFDAVPLWDSMGNHNRRDTGLQIKGRKKSAHPPSCVKSSTVTPKIC